MPLLTEEDVDDEIAFTGAFAAGGPKTVEIGGWFHGARTVHRLSLTFYTLNEEPQPQVDFAFGFLIVKPPPVTLSTKSTSAPRR